MRLYIFLAAIQIRKEALFKGDGYLQFPRHLLRFFDRILLELIQKKLMNLKWSIWKQDQIS